MKEPEAGLVAHLTAFADRDDVPSAAAHLMRGAVETINRQCDEINQIRAMVALLRAALQECADDLEVEVRARFVDSAGMVHPALRQRYERDMEPVVRARAALTTTEGR